MGAKRHRESTSKLPTNMATAANRQPPPTANLLRARIQSARISLIDKQVLNGELDRLIRANVPLEETSEWIGEGIEASETTMAERAEIDREIFGKQRQ